MIDIDKSIIGSIYVCTDVAPLVERQDGTLLMRVRFPGAARDFPPRVNFQCRLSYGVRTPPMCNRMY